jgi:hypothetical protein
VAADRPVGFIALPVDPSPLALSPNRPRKRTRHFHDVARRCATERRAQEKRGTPTPAKSQIGSTVFGGWQFDAWHCLSQDAEVFLAAHGANAAHRAKQFRSLEKGRVCRLRRCDAMCKLPL